MKYSLRTKVLLSTALAVVIVGTVSSYLFITTTLQRENENIASHRTALLNERKQALKGHIEVAANIFAKLPPEQAIKSAAATRHGEAGYLWINDFSGTLLVHSIPDFDEKLQLELKSPNGVNLVRELTKTCLEEGEAYLSHVWNQPGKDALPKLYYAKAIPSRTWIVGTGIDTSDIERAVAEARGALAGKVSTLVATCIAITLTVLTVVLIVAFFLSNKFISEPIGIITGAIRNLNNDLTVTIPVSTADELGTLAGWINEHIGRLNQIIGRFSTLTGKVNSHVSAIALTMEQQSGFATQLSSSVVEISSTMEEFSSTARQIAQHSQGVVERADKTLEDSKQGATEVENLTFKINDISENIQANLSEIVELGKKSKEINKIMAIINNIANQTKLIAFNAALEAASAGEEGKRFGVVAVEIRRLADSVVESTSEIEGKITEILDSVNRLVMSSEKSFQLIQEGQEYASHTVAMLIESVDGVDETASAAKQISLSTQQQQIASSQVVLALKDIEQGVHHATDSIHQSNIVTGELSELSEQLGLLVRTFKISKAVGEKETAPSV